MQRDPVVRPDRLHLDPERVAQPRGERHRPRRVHAAAERRQDADAPVADLVAEALDHDRAVGRHGAGRARLLAQVGEQVARGALVEVVVGARAASSAFASVSADELARRARRSSRPARTAGRRPRPSRTARRRARPGAGETSTRSRVISSIRQRRGAEQERLALPRLVDHLLVELADAPAAVDEVDAEEAAVGDRAGVRDREPARARAAADHARGAVPDDPRAQLGELVRGVAAGEHVEHVLELLAREVGERIGAADEPCRARRPRSRPRPRSRRSAARARRAGCAGSRLLDRAVAHRARDDGGLEQVGAELGEDAALRDGAELVAGAADPLQPARDRLRALDLDHEVDGAHVDAELEARGGDEARDLPRLQQLLDLDALLARERAVVGAGDLFLGELVQPQREPLGEAAVVDEDDRRAVLAHEREQLGVDRRPDRADARPRCSTPSTLPSAVGRVVVARVPPGSRMSSTRDDDLEVELLARARVDELDRAVAGDEAADLLERPLRRREADRAAPAARASASSRSSESARCAPRFVPATACTSSTITVSTVREHRARLRGEHQEERLGRRDQDVRRRAQRSPRAPSAGCRRCGRPTRSSERSPASGPRRLRSTS